MITRRTGLAVGAVAMVALSAACESGTKAGMTFRDSATTTTSATVASDQACQLLPPEIVAMVPFPVAVKRVPSQSFSRDGLTSCQVGDQHSDGELSLNSIGLLIAAPAFLRARHLTVRRATSLAGSLCVAATLRVRGVRTGPGTSSAVCVGKPGSTRGVWTRGGVVYNLDIVTTSDDSLPYEQRLDRWGRVARAIDALTR